ncbi:mitochondrial dna helicase [Moniliophthora roreri]|nr:mitochondrial dna helicase [Moniliophthora roreri]
MASMAGSKRKANSNTSSAPAPKKPRQTIQHFFSPKVPVPCKSENQSLNEPTHVALNPQQTRVLRMVVDEEKSLFFTGAAGTGKSLLLRAIINALRKKYAKDKDAVSVTASTGMASSNIGGMTIHSWGAVSPNCQDMGSMIRCIRTCKPALQRWKKTKVLIIDEVSMVDGLLFEQLAEIATKLRKKTDRPFGGLQLVVTGDFFQLPPVTKNNQEPTFAFESPAWKSTLEHTINLTQVFRQKDSTFISALNSLRQGAPTEESVTLFTTLSRPLAPSPIVPTELFPLRHLVANSNGKRLSEIPTDSVVFTARDSGTKPGLLNNLLAEDKLTLKTGAQVMLIKNVDEVLVNGVVGKIIGFYHPWQLVGTFNPSVSKSAGSKPPSSKGEALPKTEGKKVSCSAPAIASSSALSLHGTPLTQETKKNGALLRHVLLAEDGKTPVIEASGQGDKENNELKPAGKGKGKAATADRDMDEKYPLVLFEYPAQDDSGRTLTEAVLIKRDEFRVEDAEGKVMAHPKVIEWSKFLQEDA